MLVRRTAAHARLVFTAGLALALTAVPQLALACPACVGDAGNNYTFLKLGAVMSLVPFGIVGMVLWVLRQAPKS